METQKHLGSRNGDSGSRDSNRKEGYRPGENAVMVAQSPPGLSCRHFDRGGRLDVDGSKFENRLQALSY